MESGRSPLVSIPPFGAGIFKASRSTDPLRIWKQRKEQVPALPFIVSMSPPGYPSAWLRLRRARFRFARQDDRNSATSIGPNFRMRRQQEFSLTNFGSERNRLITVIASAILPLWCLMDLRTFAESQR